jgi:hypothetical protein
MLFDDWADHWWRGSGHVPSGRGYAPQIAS